MPHAFDHNAFDLNAFDVDSVSATATITGVSAPLLLARSQHWQPLDQEAGKNRSGSFAQSSLMGPQQCMLGRSLQA
jgi:hypothetical protein